MSRRGRRSADSGTVPGCVTEDGWDREETRPTQGAARSEAFRGLAEALAAQLDEEAERRAQLGSALDRQTSEACRAMARRARVVASRFASWSVAGGWDASRRADIEEYDELAAAARGFGLPVGAPVTTSVPPGPR